MVVNGGMFDLYPEQVSVSLFPTTAQDLIEYSLIFAVSNNPSSLSYTLLARSLATNGVVLDKMATGVRGRQTGQQWIGREGGWRSDDSLTQSTKSRASQTPSIPPPKAVNHPQITSTYSSLGNLICLNLLILITTWVALILCMI